MPRGRIEVMSSKKFWAALVLALVPVAAGAQEAENEATEPQAPRQRLRVLEHPRDIASFEHRAAKTPPVFRLLRPAFHRDFIMPDRGLKIALRLKKRTGSNMQRRIIAKPQ